MSFPDLNPDFTEENFRRLVDAVNTLSQNITLDSNLDGQIVSNLSITAGNEVRISHSLKTVPKYRIILRTNDSDAIVSDGVEAWNEKYITLKNQSLNDIIITVIIMRR